MQDAVARWDHVNVFERLFGPVDEVETILVATVFNGAIFFKCVRVEATTFNRKRVIDHQLRRHHRVDHCGVAALGRNRVAQAREID